MAVCSCILGLARAQFYQSVNMKTELDRLSQEYYSYSA